MNKTLKNILRVAIPLVIIYLIISSIYIVSCIDFGAEPDTVSMGFSNSTNLMRTFMGLPKTYSTYEGVSPKYLIQVTIKIIIAIVLLFFYSKVNEKIKRKWIIAIIITLLCVVTSVVGLKLFVNSNIASDKSNIQIDEVVEGNYTGYQLVLEANYGGAGVSGQDLGSGTIVKVYNISDNDTFFEPFNGGTWKLNLEETKDNSRPFSATIILKIDTIEEDTILLEFEDKKYVAKYDEEINISSNAHIYDGINYSYKIKISKDK